MLPKDLPPTALQMLKGKTPAFASTYDQRFSFSMYIPKGHKFNGPKLPLLVIIHGTRRQTGSYINKLQDFGDTHRCAIMVPLFPAGIIDPMDVNNYKTLLFHDIRFDRLLLSMVDQAADIWSLRTDKFFLHGFSGGGQFAHRFFYLYPDRLAAVSVGAPGRITPPDVSTAWPNGLADASHLFGVPSAPNFRAMAAVPTQFVVGAEDLEETIFESIKRPNTVEAESGKTRVDRIRWLKGAFEKQGVKVELVEVPGIGHEGIKIMPSVEAWLGPLVDKMRHGHGH